MRERRRSPLGAWVITCALLLTASPMFGGAVCDREDDASTKIISADSVRPSEWMVEILGEEYIAARVQSLPSDAIELPDRQLPPEISDAFPTPRATVIPLPAPIWNGIIGLGVAATALLIGKFRKRLL